MLLLGIESSCDETAAAVVEDGRKILSSVIASQVEEHKIYGGVVPEIASRRHSEAISGVVGEALSQSGKALSDLDGIAVTYAPGLIGALLVGVNFAKGLALSAGLPPHPGAPFAGAHRLQLPLQPGAGAPLPVPGGLRGPQPYRVGGGLHPPEDPGTHPG